MKEGLRFVLVVVVRFIAITAIVGIFLPPDSQNPHAIGDVVLCGVAAFAWSASEIVLRDFLKDF